MGNYKEKNSYGKRATGIVRRIDDLGRIVIPKEVRKTLKIREGDPLEIFTSENGEIVLKKYSPLGELNEFSQEYAESLGETLGHGVIVTDLDVIVATSNVTKKSYKNKDLSKELEVFLKNRQVKNSDDEKLIPLCEDDSMDYRSQIIIPIISSSGDCIGAICLVSKKDEVLNKNDEKILKVAANFLGKQVQ